MRGAHRKLLLDSSGSEGGTIAAASQEEEGCWHQPPTSFAGGGRNVGCRKSFFWLLCVLYSAIFRKFHILYRLVWHVVDKTGAGPVY